MPHRVHALLSLLFRCVVLVCLVGWAPLVHGAPAKRQVRVGVVMDGPSAAYDEVRNLIADELRKLVGSEFALEIKGDKRIVADWTAKGVNDALDKQFTDPEVDLVVALGVIASNQVVTRKALPKPAVAPFVLSTRLQGLEDASGRVVRKNLSYVEWSLNLPRDLKAFGEVSKPGKMAFLRSAPIDRALPSLGRAVRTQSAALKVAVVDVLVEDTADQALAAIPKDVDTVYLAPNPQLPPAEVDKLAEGLIARKLPSFSWLGRAEVEQGILCGLGAPEDLERLARRVALNIQSILLGEKPSRLSTAFKLHEQLVVNMATARKIGLWPDWRVLTDAQLINQKRENIKRKLTLASTVREAMRVNLDAIIARQNLAAGKQNVNLARSNLLPQADGLSSATVIDSDRAAFGQAQFTALWQATLSQPIYSDRAWAGFQIEKHLQRSRKEQRREIELDVQLAVAIAYLDVLRTQTVEGIQRSNLGLARSNLALARVRRQIGTAGPGEVYRWEAEIANRRRDLIAAVASRNQAEIQLNRLLNRPLEEPFTTREASLDDPVLLTGQQRMQRYMSNPLQFKLFREFMVEEGLRASPELKQVDAVIAAQDRTVKANRRAFWLPDFALFGSVAHRFAQAGEGADNPMAPMGFEAFVVNRDRFDLSAGVSLSIPLSVGGARIHALKQSKIDRRRLTNEQRAVALQVEQRVRASLHAAGASFPAIELTREAAEASNGNLKAVTDGYSRGKESIITLLDAQNQALVSQLAASNAVYFFIADLMQVERAVGKFDFFKDEREMSDFFDRLDRFAASRGGGVGPTSDAQKEPS